MSYLHIRAFLSKFPRYFLLICDLSSDNPAYALLCYLQENINLYNFAKIVEFHFLTDFKSVMTTLSEYVFTFAKRVLVCEIWTREDQ